jgi:ribosomal protein S18 acetylase RimI-like enzyme
VPTAARWSLRPLDPSELEWAFELEVAVMGDYIAASRGWDRETHRAIFDEQIVGDSLQVIEVVADRASPPSRAGLLRVDEHRTELALEIMELGPEWQGRGIGGEIISELLGRAEALGKPLTLFALTSDTRAIAFYERHGLRILGREPHRVFMSSGGP